MAQKPRESDLSSVELWFLLERTVFGISRMREIELDQFGLTVAQAAILTALRDHGDPMTLQQLVRQSMRQHHSVSTLISRMAQMGLVSKSTSPADKRYRIALTQDGLEQCRRITFAAFEMTFSVLSSGQKAKLSAILSLLLTRVRRLLDGAQSSPFNLCLKTGEKEERPPDVKGMGDVENWALLDRIGFGIARLCELELAQFSLTPPQASILYEIEKRGGEATLQELEDNSMRQHHSIFILINRMTKAGLVERLPGPRGQAPRMVMTAAGKEMNGRLTTISLDMSFAALSAEQCRELTGCLIPLQERARHLLGLSYIPPFVKYLMTGNAGQPG